MPDDPGLRPVFDPALTARDRGLLAEDPARLVPAHLPAPVRARPAPAARAAGIPLFALFYGVLPGGWFHLFFTASLDEEDPFGRVLRWGRLPLLAMMLTPGVQVVLLLCGQREAAAVLAAASFAAWCAGAARAAREPAAARAARELHGRYLLPADLDGPAARLLARAQRAVDAVLGSAAHRAGLLDAAGNAAELPREEWEIAGTLAEHTRLRRERSARDAGRLSAPVRELLRSRDAALEASVRSVTARIAALEDYARRAAEADDAYHEWRVLQALPEQDARDRELLARTVRDDLARDRIARLAGDARAAAEALRAAADPPD
ncbi:hypothetical protein [Actinomadura parmotrematis]|uniref:Integral membrane protein n=1 Tax=Actinomadura parmotrematis TaxID=2864039 RepID=A0ABS7FLG1_9ACTN|nr:hypothetical protein [Actinomadura parmotrematis]MBW8481196.1 hypothetical protein [Actinomadura parmotrematis]